MFFAGISGSSTADVAVLSRTVAPEMDKEGYDRAFTAALIASASTMANLIPPSIMAIVYGATGNVSIGGLFLAGVVPGVLIGLGLMVYSYVWGPPGFKKKRASYSEIALASKEAAMPLMIPVIIMGGILSGWFTPTEAGMIACVYVLLVLIPIYRPRHVYELPRDFMYAGLLYRISMEGEGEGDEEYADEEGAEEGADAGLEDRVVDLEDKLDELMAEFESLMDPEGGEDMAMDAEPGDEVADEFAANMDGEEVEDDELETEGMMENVSLKAVPKPTAGDHGANSKSVVASNSGARGAMAKPVTTTGAEATGRPAPTAKDAIGKVGNTPAQSTQKPTPATKPSLGQAAGVNNKSVIQ
jgi:hypothetical protein